MTSTCPPSKSISAGPARFPEDGSTFEDLLAAADERMYRDKAVRRGRIGPPPHGAPGAPMGDDAQQPSNVVPIRRHIA